ncbi:hypothetical protein ACSFA0_01080 [Variovorax sp. LT1P1]|uniref:hypothetical protein n=1 Tax=Variovorax sp. LT1P1 TaxID=3443730 RepID=UPI003F4819B4
MNEDRSDAGHSNLNSFKSEASHQASDRAQIYGGLPAVLDWQCAFWSLVLQTQGDVLKQWMDWQNTASLAQQDAWDRWTCRFGGGVPLDG